MFSQLVSTPQMFPSGTELVLLGRSNVVDLSSVPARCVYRAVGDSRHSAWDQSLRTKKVRTPDIGASG